MLIDVILLLAHASLSTTTAPPDHTAPHPPMLKVKAPRAVVPLDQILADPASSHGQAVVTEGVVASVCPDEGCFIDLVPRSGSGPGTLVFARNNAFTFPLDSVGKIATVRGTFFTKIYPYSRMHHWHHHGWRADQQDIPEFAPIFRIAADDVSFRAPEPAVHASVAPLVPLATPLFDLDAAQFESARMSTGKVCLVPGESSPTRHTQRYHELVVVLEGTLTVHTSPPESPSGVLPTIQALPVNHALYLTPRSSYRATNTGHNRACYLFVYSLPEPAPRPTHAPPGAHHRRHRPRDARSPATR